MFDNNFEAAQREYDNRVPFEENYPNYRDLAVDAFEEIQMWLQDEDIRIIDALERHCKEDDYEANDIVSDVLISLVNHNLSLPPARYESFSHRKQAKHIYLLTLCTLEAKKDLVIDFLAEDLEKNEDILFDEDGCLLAKNTIRTLKNFIKEKK